MQTLSTLADSDRARILCYYVNGTKYIQTARIINSQNFHFERVIFPGQRLMFEAVPTAHLEIQTCIMNDEIMTDRITCIYLRVNETTTGFKSVTPASISI